MRSDIGKDISDWEEKTLGDIITFQRGHDLPKTKFKGGQYPIIGSNGIIGYHNEFTTKENGITIGRSGSIGNPFFHRKRFWAHNTTLYVKEFHNSDPKFVYYFLTQLNFQSLNSGSAVPSLNRNYIHPFPIRVPNLSEQKKIAKILSCIDSKIGNLQQQNQTLEKIAQTLFKQWFIDFNFPDENGKPYKDNGGEMVGSELGEIPQGWNTRKILDLVTVTDFVANGSFKSLKENVTTYDAENFAMYVRLVDYNKGFTTNLKYVDNFSYNFLKKSKLHGDEVIISNIGANAGTVFRPPSWLNIPMTLGSNSIMFFSKDYTEYLYHYLFTNIGKHTLHSIIGGSAQPKFNKTDFRNIELIIPEDGLVLKFNKIAIHIRDKIFNNNGQIQTLTNTRDTMLPKLMSGQIRVSD